MTGAAQLERALESLRILLPAHEKSHGDPVVALGLRDGAIQRFEYTYEFAWKIMKLLLEQSTEPQPTNRRDLFRQAWEVGYIDDPRRWENFNIARNETSHAYKSEYADRVFLILPDFIAACEILIGNLKQLGHP